MATALDVLNVARTQIGFHEGSNNENPYGIWYGSPNAPYCAMGISWCFAQVGLSHLIAAQTPKGFSYNPAALPWFQRQGMVVNKFQAQAGDLAFFDWNGDGVVDHVELIEAASAGGFTTIAFNTGSPNDPTKEGCWRVHRNYLFVMAIVRPKYQNIIKPTVAVSKTKKATAAVATTGALVAGATGAVHTGTTFSTPATTKSNTVFVAPPFPADPRSFIPGAQSQAVLTVNIALAKAGLLDATYVTAIMTAQSIAGVKKYEKLHPKLNVTNGTVNQLVYDNLKGSL